jgi:predicted NUDIX family NTP pyrophosphohydrolase
MPQKSAGILLYHFRKNKPEVFLVHPGGPFWAKKDLGAWSIPKGEYNEDENPLDAARREFNEETGLTVDGNFMELGEVKQPSGKLIIAWALATDLQSVEIKSNTFKLKWPPKSGKIQEFPEVDRAEWFSMEDAYQKILKGQIPFLKKLEQRINYI